MNKLKTLTALASPIFLFACLDGTTTEHASTPPTEPGIEIRLAGKDFDPSIMDSLPTILEAKHVTRESGSHLGEALPKVVSTQSFPSGDHSWTQLPGHSAKDVALGVYPYHIDSNGRLRRYRNGSWEYPSMPYATVKRIDAQVINGIEHIVAVGGNGAIYRYRSDTGNWTYMAGTHSGEDVSISTDGTIMHIGSGGQIYRFNGSGWNQIPGSARRLSAHWMDTWVRNTSDVFSFWEGSYWVDDVRTHDVSDVCGTDTYPSAGGLYHIGSGTVYLKGGANWLPDANTHSAKDIACGPSGIMHTNTSGNIFIWYQP